MRKPWVEDEGNVALRDVFIGHEQAGGVNAERSAVPVATITEDRTARLWEIPKLPVDPLQIGTWTEVFTGMILGLQGSATTLDQKGMA